MLRIVIIIGMILLTFLKQDVARAVGDFSRTCNNIVLHNGSFLEADCRTIQGNTALTGIQLNNLIANLDGRLDWRPNGNYIASSQNCDLDFVPPITVLDCDTQRANGTWTSSTLNLDQRIANIDGQLGLE